MGDALYTIGIDLGTSNCAMAFAPLHGPAQGKVTDFPVLQLEGLGQINPRPLFPSCLYLPTDSEKSSATLTLPWPSEASLVSGEFARRHGARVTGRLITSAKSWLCHPGVDRTAPILPWSASGEVERISPVTASSLLLRHMRHAWDHAHPESPLHEQEVVITVPASFDEVARALTATAAKSAGIEKFTLLEEPQAAFYDFTARHRAHLARMLEHTRLILVVDVGGGTTDLTLVQAALTGDHAGLRRIAVGDHLMLGGDNMDAAVAHHLEQKWTTHRKLSAGQWTQLLQAARAAKEDLLQHQSMDRTTVAIAGEGSKLFGSTLTTTVLREDLERLILEGFIPFVSAGELTKKSSKLAIQEVGLPYVTDPAITRHIADFLRKHAMAGWAALGTTTPQEVPVPLPRPDAILLNGGVFNSPKIADRLVEVVSSWWPSQPRIPLLAHDSLDLAVARGAAYYGLVRHGLGQRISGGAARAYYIGLVQKKSGDTQALCLIPRGFEEGESIELTERIFQLTLGKPVQFPLYSTTADRVDRSGDIIDLNDELQALAPIQTVLKSARHRVEKIPVHLLARLTELGTLELFCVAGESNQRWRLEFDLRRAAAADQQITTIEAMPARFADARLYIELFYGSKPPLLTADSLKSAPKEVKHLWAALERLLGARESWSLPVLREISSAMLAGMTKRRRTADHEKIFCQLLGYSLRPGFGYSLDDWRCDQASKIFADSVQFQKEKPNWNEFWILWRRISGGLTPEFQNKIWELLKPTLAARAGAHPDKTIPKLKGTQPEGLDEMVRTAAALEHVAPAEKSWLGNLILNRLTHSPASGGPWLWALGRIGSRAPLYGSIHNVVPPEIAAQWLETLLSLAGDKLEGSSFALAQLARKTNDRIRDIPEPLRQKVLTELNSAGASPAWLAMVQEAQELQATDEARAFGDSLPAGLQL